MNSQTPLAGEALEIVLRRKESSGNRFQGLTGAEARRLVELGVYEVDTGIPNHPEPSRILELAERFAGVRLGGFWPQAPGDYFVVDTVEGWVPFIGWFDRILPLVRGANELDYGREGKGVVFRAWWD